MTAETPLTIAGVLALATGLVLLGGPLGGVAAGTAALALFIPEIPRLFGVLYAQLLVAVLTPSLGLPVAIAELGVLLMFAPVARTYTRAFAVGGGIAVAGVVWTLWVWPAISPLAAAGSLLVVLATGLYGLHRYELVRLNLVQSSHE